MNNKNIISITDRVSISDMEMPKPAIGIVKIFKDNKLYIEKNNMIVKSGRSLLFNMMQYHVKSDTNIASSYKFGIGFSYLDDEIRTTPEMQFADVTAASQGNVDYYKILADQQPAFDNTDLTMTFTATLDNSTTDKLLKFNNIFLVYYTVTDDVVSDYTLFSRVALDPVFLSNDNTYTLKYTLYF